MQFEVVEFLNVLTHPELTLVILDYVSGVEMFELDLQGVGLKLKRNYCADEITSLDILTKRRTKTYTRAFMLQAPDYLCYCILLYVKYNNNTLRSLVESQPEYMHLWLAQSAYLSMDEHRVGEVLLKYALLHKNAHILHAMVSNPALFSSVIPVNLHDRFVLTLKLLQPYAELVVKLVKRPDIPTTSLVKVLSYTLEEYQAEVNEVIFRRLDANPVMHHPMYASDDPLYRAITRQHQFIGPAIRHKLFQSSSMYFYLLPHCDLSQEHLELIINALGVSLKIATPPLDSISHRNPDLKPRVECIRQLLVKADQRAKR